MTASASVLPAGPGTWAWLTAEEVQAGVRAGAVGLWAIGATEQHGRHLVTGFDHLASETVVRRAAAQLGDRALVLPTLPLGCSEYWVDLGGTLSLALGTMQRVIVDVCRSASRAGLRHLVIVNGHSGNAGVALTAINEFGVDDLVVELVSYWDMLDRERLLAIQAVEDGFGHAGEMETSIGLHLDGFAREARIPPSANALDPGAPGGSQVVFHRAPRPATDSDGGVIGDAGAGTAAVGEAVIALAVEGLVAHCRELLGTSARVAG